MGYYINLPNMTKEQWLEENGIFVKKEERSFQDPKEGLVLVCLVNNFGFSAAAIVHNIREYREFTNPSDDRPKTWFLVETSKLKEIPGINLPF